MLEEQPREKCFKQGFALESSVVKAPDGFRGFSYPLDPSQGPL